MRRGRQRIGSGRLWRGLLGVATFGLLSGCGWLFGDSAPVHKARPGAERQVAPGAALPAPAAGQGYDASIVPLDDTRQPQIGSIVQGKGGQKAQKEAADKESAERDAKAREEREKREAQEKEAKETNKEAEKEKPAPVPVTAGVPARPAAAAPGNADNAGPAAPAGPLQAPVAPAATGAVPQVPAAPAPAPGPDQSPAPPRT